MSDTHSTRVHTAPLYRSLIPFVLIAGCLFCPAFAQRDMVFTQFAAGAGLSCDVFITNQTSSAVSGVVVSFFDRTGAPLTVTSDLGTANGYTFDLALGETKVIRFPSTAPLATGYATIQTPATSSVCATEIFRFESGGSVLFEVGVPQQNVASFFTFPAEVKQSSQVSTGVAVAYPTFGDPTATAQNIVVNLIASDGVLQESKAIEVAPGGYFSLYLEEPGLFPGLDNFTGSVCVTGSGTFSVLALRKDKNGVGGVAVNEGPVLGPFVLDSAPVNEVEPNNARTQAQVLMGDTLVSGVISTPGGLDHTSFAGKQGEIVSFLASAEGLGGIMSPAITLQKEDGTVIAFNDWARLMAGGAAFLQVVLPEDATYFVQVADRWGQGGPNALYRLHAKVPTNSGPPPPPPAPLLVNWGPQKAMQGAAFNLVLLGANLLGADGLVFTPGTGITANITGGNDGYLEAAVTIAGGTAPGVRELKVTHAGAISNALDFEVVQQIPSPFLNGVWTGKTSEGKDVSFTITNGNLTQISFGYTIVGTACSSTGTQSSTGQLGPITNKIERVSTGGSTEYTFFGVFDSSKSASGWVKITTTQGCVGNAIATWTATRP